MKTGEQEIGSHRDSCLKTDSTYSPHYPRIKVFKAEVYNRNRYSFERNIVSF